MSEAKQYITIQNNKIPIIIRNYKHSQRISLYFKGNILNISKPSRMSAKEMVEIIKQYEGELIRQYTDILSKENTKIKHWYTGEKIMYQGEPYEIQVIQETRKTIKMAIKPETKQIQIKEPENLTEEDRKHYLDASIKRLLKQNTYAMIERKLPIWSEKTKIQYHSFKVGDATSKYGSCIPSRKALHFSNRLIMLPEDKVDAVIVHELCHMVHRNHSKDFYDLVETYIPNYKEIDKWLKKNSNQIMI